MKKLMIAAAVAVAASFANAAAIDWQINTSYNPFTAAGEGESAPLINGGFYVYAFAQSASLGANVDLVTRDAVLEAAAGGDYAFLAKALTDGSITATEIENGYGGYAAGYGFGDFASGTGYDGAALNKVDAFLVITDAADVEDIKNVYVTDLASTYIDANDTADTLDYGDLTGTQYKANWIAATTTPEPTSGLLLLLGVAGLALRRRRA